MDKQIMDHTPTQKNKPHILLVEDTKSLAQMYEHYLLQQGYDVTSVLTGTDALDHIAKNHVDLVLLDLKLPDMDGRDVMNELRDLEFSAPIIIITGNGSINTAVEAMRLGAWDFLVKPFNVDRLGDAVQRAVVTGRFDPTDLMNSAPASTLAAPPPPLQKSEQAAPAAQPILQTPPKQPTASSAAKDDLQTWHINDTDGPSSYRNDDGNMLHDPALMDKSQQPDFGGFIGTSAVMQALYKQLENAARSQAPVFITGQSGTGKEVCAEAIHKHSSRANRPFIPINCAAIPKDLIESELFGHVKGAFTGAIQDRDGAAKLANGGTLFLDEIGEMDVSMQTKLLRFLQNYTFQKVGGSRLERTDIRIICATNRDPQWEIQRGNFREDLFYRLHVIPIYMPPLAQRGDDVIDIAHALLRRYAAEENKDFKQFSEEAEMRMRHHHWPGNIRELQNLVRHIVVMHDGQTVTSQMLPAHLGMTAPQQTHQSQHAHQFGQALQSGQSPQDFTNMGQNAPHPATRSSEHLQNANMCAPQDFLGSLPDIAGLRPAQYTPKPQNPDNFGQNTRPQTTQYQHQPHTQIHHMAQPIAQTIMGHASYSPAPFQKGIKPLWLSEKQAIEEAIAYCNGNIPKAAILLEVSPSTIYRKKNQWDEAMAASTHAQNTEATPEQNGSGQATKDENETAI